MHCQEAVKSGEAIGSHSNSIASVNSAFAIGTTPPDLMVYVAFFCIVCSSSKQADTTEPYQLICDG